MSCLAISSRLTAQPRTFGPRALRYRWANFGPKCGCERYGWAGSKYEVVHGADEEVRGFQWEGDAEGVLALSSEHCLDQCRHHGGFTDSLRTRRCGSRNGRDISLYRLGVWNSYPITGGRGAPSP